MYYFSEQAGRFKDYYVVWFDIDLLIWYKSVCGTSDHVETAHFNQDSHCSGWTLSSLLTIAYFNENQESKNEPYSEKNGL